MNRKFRELKGRSEHSSKNINSNNPVRILTMNILCNQSLRIEVPWLLCGEFENYNKYIL
jgi:hypothetical protein